MPLCMEKMKRNTKIMKHVSVSKNNCNAQDQREKKETAHIAVNSTVPIARATSSFV